MGEQVILIHRPARQVALSHRLARQVILSHRPVRQVALSHRLARQVILSHRPVRQVASLGPETGKFGHLVQQLVRHHLSQELVQQPVQHLLV
ncbi:hypothetical protein [Ktedonobacter sp. SOSP1-52]|uniref:hypothetical protein n=1 Tax=Ktedonobacter sp. SOSP1-52 TaxID=2778366 RepID=UPI00191569CA|nr:hypothetical protein [Ktedonobacter sp. SOSP1-52]